MILLVFLLLNDDEMKRDHVSIAPSRACLGQIGINQEKTIKEKDYHSGSNSVKV